MSWLALTDCLSIRTVTLPEAKLSALVEVAVHPREVLCREAYWRARRLR